MKRFRFITLISVFSALFTLALSSSAGAYLDPATGTYLVSAIAGVVITCGVMVGVFWGKIKAFFRNMRLKSLEKKLSKQAAKNETVEDSSDNT